MTLLRIFWGLLILIAASLAHSQDDRPNMLLILADDLGYTDLGAYGGEIRTPNIDELAIQSIRFTDFHAMPLCAPTRAVLLSGTDNHVNGLGAMVGDRVLSGVSGRVGYERYLHERITPLPQVLSDAGYHTYMAGKWHLGEAEGQWPVDRGFEQSFALLPGAGSHFLMSPGRYVENDRRLEEQLEGFYSTRTYTDKLLNYIDSNHGDGRPFFAYAAYTAPHWPLQVPEDYIDRYAGEYDEGYDALRVQRIERARQLGVIPDLDTEDGFEHIGPAWSELDEETKRHYARRMEIYAAMVENLDHHIGRLIDHLEQLGELENTLIIFLSDNGADGDEVDLNPNFDFWQVGVDNSLENIGQADSFIAYGHGWAQAAMAPFSREKGFANEGGTRVPAFIHYPDGSYAPGLNDQYLSVIDVAPTLIELAGTDHPGALTENSEVVPMLGRSFASLLHDETATIYGPDHSFANELHGGRSVRRGNFKLVWEQPAAQSWWGGPVSDSWYRWRLFDLATDPSESRDVSLEYPLLKEEMIQEWEDYADSLGVARDVRIRNFERWQRPE